MKVTAVLVTHNGERWLPRVLDALATQTAGVDQFVVVDTGSSDRSAELVTAAIGRSPLELPADTGFGTAVAAALESAPSLGEDEWVWLLHDDAAPDADCLAQMREAAAACSDEIVALGPKLREWPTLRRLLEVGVTVTGTGRRETGLEPGEPDQGQHDDVSRVLAVNTAGMLVRRDALEYFGFAPELPLFANDLDFGWRLAARSLQTHVVPTAVMFHAEASYRGMRDAELARHHRRDARAAEMFVVLSNGSRRWHAVRLLRMFISGLLRAFGFSLVRAFPEARAELAALGSVYGPSRRHHRARRERQAAASAPASEVKNLLAPVWMPWRHGLDFVIAFVQAVAAIAADRFRARLAEQEAKGPLAQRILRTPTAYVLVGLFLMALIVEHRLMGPGPIAGGALLPAPDGPGHWWSLWWSSWHWVGEGSSVAGPPYALPMATLSTIAFGQPGFVIWLIFGMGIPLAAIGAWRFAVRFGLGAWAQAWVTLAYALVPVALGAVAGGHLGTMVVAILLPWIGRAGLAMAASSAETRERSVWRFVFVTGLAVCFAPVLAFFALLLAIAAPLVGLGALRRRQRWVLGVGPLLVMVPWLVSAVRAPASFLVEAGAAASSHRRLGALDQLVGTLPGVGHIAAWLLLGIPLAAAAALIRRDTRTMVMRCWMLAALSAVASVTYVFVTLDLPGEPGFVPYLGVPLLLQMAALIAAVGAVTPALREVVMATSFGYRQIAVSALTVFAIVAPVAGLVGWASSSGDAALRGDGTGVAHVRVPIDFVNKAVRSPVRATLIVSGGAVTEHARRVSYTVQRAPVVLGDDAILAMTPHDRAIGRAVAQALSGNSSGAATVLARAGIGYVYAPNPVAPIVAGAFDADADFVSMYPSNPSARAWQVDDGVGSEDGLAQPGLASTVVHRVALGLQLLVLLVVVVLAAPGRGTEFEPNDVGPALQPEPLEPEDDR